MQALINNTHLSGKLREKVKTRIKDQAGLDPPAQKREKSESSLPQSERPPIDRKVRFLNSGRVESFLTHYYFVTRFFPISHTPHKCHSPCPLIPSLSLRVFIVLNCECLIMPAQYKHFHNCALGKEHLAPPTHSWP